MKSNLDPLVKNLALKYKVYTKKSLERSLRWAKRHYKKYLNYLVTEDFYRRYEHKEKYIYKEFIFQGFVPEEEFKKKPECNYLISNRSILGKKLIYPVHCGHNYETIKKGYPEIYSMLDVAGVPGYTKVDVKFVKLKEDGDNKKKRKRRRKSL